MSMIAITIFQKHAQMNDIMNPIPWKSNQHIPQIMNNAIIIAIIVNIKESISIIFYIF